MKAACSCPSSTSLLPLSLERIDSASDRIISANSPIRRYSPSSSFPSPPYFRKSLSRISPSNGSVSAPFAQSLTNLAISCSSTSRGCPSTSARLAGPVITSLNCVGGMGRRSSNNSRSIPFNSGAVCRGSYRSDRMVNATRSEMRWRRFPFPSPRTTAPIISRNIPASLVASALNNSSA